MSWKCLLEDVSTTSWNKIVANSISDQSKTSLRPKLRRFYDVFTTSLCRLGSYFSFCESFPDCFHLLKINPCLYARHYILVLGFTNSFILFQYCNSTSQLVAFSAFLLNSTLLKPSFLTLNYSSPSFIPSFLFPKVLAKLKTYNQTKHRYCMIIPFLDLY